MGVEDERRQEKSREYSYTFGRPGPPRLPGSDKQSESQSVTVPPAEGETVTNAAGGSQSHVLARYDCIDPTALRLVAECHGFGESKYGADNWRKIPPPENVNHAIAHLIRWQEGDRQEPHLANAATRCLFALAQAIGSGEQPPTYNHPELEHGRGATAEA